MTTTASQAVLDAAVRSGRVDAEPSLPEAIAPARRKIILAIDAHTRHAHETVGVLPYGRIHGIFLYAVCRGYEAAYYWRTGGDYEVSTAEMFTGEVPCNVSDEMFGRLREIPLADELFDGFTKWAAAHAGTLDKDADVFAPIMDALSMSYNVAYAVGLRVLDGDA